MSINFGAKNRYTEQILRFLSQKRALPLKIVLSKVEKDESKENNIALMRSLSRLQKKGLIKYHHSGQKEYVFLTNSGRRKASSLKLDSRTELFNPVWDKKWRLIVLDLPEDRKTERESLRYLLKKAGFKMVKNSVWLSPYPFEHFFANLKKDFGLKNEMIILVTDDLDPISNQSFFELFFKT